MDSKTQEEIDKAARYQWTCLPNADAARGVVFYGYQNGKLYSEPLAYFLADAQNNLAEYALRLNDNILNIKTLEDIRKNLEKTLSALKSFNEAIENKTGYTLDCDDHNSGKRFEEALKILQGRPAYWPRPEQAFDVSLLANTAIFSLKPPKKAEEEPQVQGQKLYTVFVGSTYKDMKEIRAAVLQRLNSSKEYIPIGMENFMASYKSQLEYIENRLKDTDIYVLILGGRYGSLIPKTRPGEEDKSYTQKEFEMATQDPNIRVLSFVCSDPENLPGESRYETDIERAQVENFAKKVEHDSIVKPWTHDTSPERIAGDVYQSLTEEDKRGLRGWTRGASGSSAK